MTGLSHTPLAEYVLFTAELGAVGWQHGPLLNMNERGLPPTSYDNGINRQIMHVLTPEALHVASTYVLGDVTTTVFVAILLSVPHKELVHAGDILDRLMVFPPVPDIPNMYKCSLVFCVQKPQDQPLYQFGADSSEEAKAIFQTLSRVLMNEFGAVN